MKIVRVGALTIIILIAVSLASIPSLGQQFPLRVTSSLATFGGELGFILDRTLLDHAHPVKGSPIIHFWLSMNQQSHINGSELRIATLMVGSSPLIYGTLLVPATVLAWVKTGVSKVYLKVSASTDVGAPAIVSDRSFTLVTDLSLVDPVLRIVDARTGAPQYRFAYYDFFNVSNSVRFDFNLTQLLNLNVRSSELDAVKVYNATLTYRDQLLYASLDLESGLTHTNMLRFIRGSIAGRIGYIEGLIGDFPLLYPEHVANIAGVNVAYQPFNVTLTLYTRFEVTGGLKIERGVVKGVIARDYWRAPVASIMEPGGLQLYPSLDYTFTSPRPTISTSFHVDARNMKPGVYTILAFFRAEDPLGPYDKLPNTRSVLMTVDEGGRGTASTSLPDNPYGGRFTMVTVSIRGLDGPWVLARPGYRVYPILTVVGFDNNGTSGVEPRFTPGEYILVHGRGWRDIPFELMSATVVHGGVSVTLEPVDYRGVDRLGVLAAILKIPVDARLTHGSIVTFNLSSDSYNSYTLTATVKYERPLVYIQPKPVILKVTPSYVEAKIILGAERYPYTAFWEPESLRRFTVEAIALQPGVPGYTVYLEPLGLVVRGVNVTGLGYVVVEAPVPEVPSGSYIARVTWDTTGVNSSSKYPLVIKATAAVIIPVYGKTVLLPSPYDITVKGVAFTPNLRVYYDVPRLGLYNVSLLGLDGGEARANERGTFIGLIPLSTFARAPGLYVIRLHQAPDNGTVVVELQVTIGVPPPLTIEVRASPIRFADENIGVWVTALYGGRVASLTQVSVNNVEVTLILRYNGGFLEERIRVRAIPGDRAVFIAEFTPFTLFGPRSLGGEILVVVTVAGRYTPESQLDYATSTTLITIPPMTLRGIVEALELQSRSLPELLEVTRRLLASTDHLLAVVSDQGSRLLQSLEELKLITGTIYYNVTLIKLSLDRIEGRLEGLVRLAMRLDGNVNTSLQLLGLIKSILANVENIVLTIRGDVVEIRSNDIPGVIKAVMLANTSIISHITVEIGGVKTAIGDLRGSTIEGFKTVSDAIASLTLTMVSRLDSIHLTLARLSDTVTAMRTLVDTIANRELPSMRGSLEVISAKVGGIESVTRGIEAKVDTLIAKTGNLSEKRDVEAVKTSLLEEVRRSQASIVEELANLRGHVSTTTRNWAILNSILTLLALILIAYTIVLVRRS